MPNSSNTPDVEDIFADADNTSIGAVEPQPALDLATPSDTTTLPEMAGVRAWRRRRWWLRIAIVVGGLLVLGGIGFVAWYWWQTRSTTGPVITENINTTNVLEPPTHPAAANTNTVAPSTFSDIDHDGLSDEEELMANTNPKKKDTDEDGLSDREEVRVYLTDPRNPDTDGDGYNDGKEVENFYDPNDSNPNKRLFDLPN